MKHYLIILLLLPLSIQSQEVLSMLYGNIGMTGFSLDVSETAAPSAKAGYRAYSTGDTKWFINASVEGHLLNYKGETRVERHLIGGALHAGLHGLSKYVWLGVGGGYWYNLKNKEEIGGVAYGSAFAELRIPVFNSWSLAFTAEGGRTAADLMQSFDRPVGRNWTGFVRLGFSAQWNFNLIERKPKSRQDRADEIEY